VNPLKRLKLKSQLRNCDYVLAGTVIKQQYYDPTKPTVINNLIDEFMANPGFENALKLIEYNEMLTFYFTESCAGGLYVRKSQDSAAPSSSPSRQETASRPAIGGAGLASDEPERPSGKDDDAAPATGARHAASRLREAPRPLPDLAPPAGDAGPEAGPEPDAAAGPTGSPGTPDAADPFGNDPFENDPKRKLRRLKQQEILQESEALMEQLLSLDMRRRRQTGLKRDRDAAADGGREGPAAGGRYVSPPSGTEPDDWEAATRKYTFGRASGESGRAGGSTGFAGGWTAVDETKREAASALESPPAFAETAETGDGPATAAVSAGRKRPEGPNAPKPAWVRKPYADEPELHPDEAEPARPHADGAASAAATAGPVRDAATAGPAPEPETAGSARDPESFPIRKGDAAPISPPEAAVRAEPAAQPEQPVHRLPKRSYANVIATLKIDIHTMARQLEDCRRELSRNPPDEKQLIAWISALEDAIEEFSQVVDHLEEHQAAFGKPSN